MFSGAQLEDMQRKVACVYRWFTWQEPYGRAGEALICSLLKKLHGEERVKPQMDWDKCKLICDVRPSFTWQNSRSINVAELFCQSLW